MFHTWGILYFGSQCSGFDSESDSNDASTLTVGKAQYSCLPNDQGGIVDDLLIYNKRRSIFTSCQCVKYR
jgi:aminomethyltransferase